MAELPQQTPAPPVGEQIHMPEPSGLPILNAIGVALSIIGITISHVMIVIGLALFLVTTVVWIVKVRREIGELPAEHHH